MKKTILSKKAPVILFILVFLITLFFVSPTFRNLLNLNQYLNKREAGPTVFESKYLNFSVDLLPGFQAADETTQITIDSQGGQINVSRNGTNYDSLDSYISDFDTKRNLIASDVEKITINDYESMSRMVEFPDQSVKQKSYYIYINNWVYIISTFSEGLYDDLDQIAKSFKYTGE